MYRCGSSVLTKLVDEVGRRFWSIENSKRPKGTPLKRITKALASPPFFFRGSGSTNHPQKEKRAEARAGNILDRIGSLNFKISNRVNADIRDEWDDGLPLPPRRNGTSIGGGCFERRTAFNSSSPTDHSFFRPLSTEIPERVARVRAKSTFYIKTPLSTYFQPFFSSLLGVLFRVIFAQITPIRDWYDEEDAPFGPRVFVNVRFRATSRPVYNAPTRHSVPTFSKVPVN